MTTAKAKLEKAKKLTKNGKITAVVITAIVVVSLIAYFVIFYQNKSYNNSNDNVQLVIAGGTKQNPNFTNPVTLSKGQVYYFGVDVYFNPKDSITLFASGGNGTSMASFEINSRVTTNTITLTGKSNLAENGATNFANVEIVVPYSAESGNYNIQITGFNSAEIASSATYTFTVN